MIRHLKSRVHPAPETIPDRTLRRLIALGLVRTRGGVIRRTTIGDMVIAAYRLGFRTRSAG